jgi:hypothetical protein
MGRLEAKHWALLLGGILTALAGMLGAADHWSDVLKPQAVAGFAAQMAVIIGAIFAGAPQNPNLSALSNPGRRDSDPPSVEAVADLLRKTP